MITRKMKTLIAVVLLAITVSIGSGIPAEQLGYDAVPAAYACIHGSSSGGGC